MCNSFVCGLQRQYFKHGPARGDGAPAERGTGWEEPPPGAQGEAGHKKCPLIFTPVNALNGATHLLTYIQKYFT